MRGPTGLSIVLLAGAALVAGGPVSSSSAPNPIAPPLCTAAGSEAPVTKRMAPSADLYCMDLTARPDIPNAAGVVELGRAASPFDVAVTAEGSQRYDASVLLSGLPDPKSLGPYTTYVAWVAPPSLDPMIKLGEVRNGRQHLGPIEFDKFLVFVSAEASASVSDRTGRLVLRGMSPSIRMQQHNMIMLSRMPDTMMGMAHGGHHMSGGQMTDAPMAMWFMPPTRPRDPVMPMPGVDELVPPATPFLPGAGMDPSRLPEAKPRTTLSLKSGDTLDLTASIVRRTINGQHLVMYAYNGQVPGPLLRVSQGATVVVRFHNAIDLPSAVHWHGVRLDNASDGAVGVTQDEVRPGDGFTYRVHFPDAGIYWYHPHVREDVQQDLGLYGNILVAPKLPTAYAPANREETLILDDLLLGDQGLVPYGTETITHALMGRFGNLLLVNGDPSYRLSVGRGEVVRFYLTNVSNSRTFNLTFGGAPMKLVGADVSRFERESWVKSIAIAPAQRYIVDVRFPDAGGYALMNQVQSIDHNVGNFFADFDTLGVVSAEPQAAAPDYGGEFNRLRTNADVVADINQYRRWFSRPADKELFLTLKLGEVPFGVLQMMRRDQLYVPPVEFSTTMPMMDWLVTARQAQWILRDPATGHENMAIDWHFKLGQVVKLRIANDRSTLHPMPHPIHLHGQRFLVLAHNDVPNENMAWKDTVLIPVGGTVDLLVEMSNPGKWMVHCHIAEHLQTGMMAVFTVDK